MCAAPGTHTSQELAMSAALQSPRVCLCKSAKPRGGVASSYVRSRALVVMQAEKGESNGTALPGRGICAWTCSMTSPSTQPLGLRYRAEFGILYVLLTHPVSHGSPRPRNPAVAAPSASRLRTGTVRRTTKETDVEVTLNIDGTGICAADTSIPFLDHMMDQLASHGLFNVTVTAKVGGDARRPRCILCFSLPSCYLALRIGSRACRLPPRVSHTLSCRPHCCTAGRHPH